MKMKKIASEKNYRMFKEATGDGSDISPEENELIGALITAYNKVYQGRSDLSLELGPGGKWEKLVNAGKLPRKDWYEAYEYASWGLQQAMNKQAKLNNVLIAHLRKAK